jgi:hypothetical protein
MEKIAIRLQWQWLAGQFSISAFSIWRPSYETTG